MSILVQKVWGRAREGALLTSSQVTLELPVQEHTLSSMALDDHFPLISWAAS